MQSRSLQKSRSSYLNTTNVSVQYRAAVY